MVDRQEVMDALREVIDPEIGLNVVDLGLIYEVGLEGHDVRVKMTMTSPACPMGQMLAEQARDAIRDHVPDVRSIDVELVWSPPWHAGLMSGDAKRHLGWEV